MKQIAVFNHKGGVAKTTTTFHLAWMLAQLGKRTLVVDCDPQCNLTGIFLGDFDGEEYPFESENPRNPKNIRDAVRPAFESRPYQISPVELYSAPQCDNLFLLPGHVGLAEYESQLAVSHELSNTLSALQNLPGALRYAIETTAKNNNIEICLIDMSPSLGSLNQNLLMTSDGFIIPMAPDLFSSMALRSLARTLPRWADWGRRAAGNSILREADYPFPQTQPKYLGSVVQNFRKRARGGEDAKPTQAFQVWFDKLRETKETTLSEALNEAGLLLPEDDYISSGANPHDFLMEIASFDSLIAIAQELSKPVFAIDLDADTDFRGKVAETYREKIEDIRSRVNDAAVKIIALIEKF